MRSTARPLASVTARTEPSPSTCSAFTRVVTVPPLLALVMRILAVRDFVVQEVLRGVLA